MQYTHVHKSNTGLHRLCSVHTPRPVSPYRYCTQYRCRPKISVLVVSVNSGIDLSLAIWEGRPLSGKCGYVCDENQEGSRN